MKLALSSLAASLVWALVWIAAPVTVMAQGASSGDGITLYNAQHPNLTKAWADGFTRDSGIKVTCGNGGDTELGNQIVQEGAASPADVFLTENSPAMILVDTAGLLAPARKRYSGPRARLFPGRHRTLGGGCGAHDRLRLQQEQAGAGPVAEVAHGPRRSGLEGPLGRIAERARTSKPSSARCWSSRARPRPRPGSRP